MTRATTLFLTFALTVFPSLTFAAKDAAEHGEASKGGLPQFEPTWFASQIFWLAICFGVLYFIFAKKTLPDISGTIENRKNHIQSDLEMAEKLTAEADAVHDAYQEGLTKAQGDATDSIKSVENKAKAQAEEAMDSFRQKSETAILDAEQRIEISKQAAMSDMNQIVVDSAAQAVEKITGISADKTALSRIVETISQTAPDNKNSKAA